MINYIVGDLFTSKDQVLVHGCNCMHRMGSGVAKRVKELYPEAFTSDTENSSYGDRGKLGTYTYISTRHFMYKTPLLVVNAYIQYNFGSNVQQVDYLALETVMYKISSVLSDKSISMPMIGSGLAGGDWTQIEKILSKVFQHQTINIYRLQSGVQQ